MTTKSAGGEASLSISGDSADARGVALVRVVNAAPASQAMIVRTDELHALPPVEYKSAGAYQQIDKTWATFEVRGTPAGSYEPLATNRELLRDGHRYTLVVMRDEDGQRYDTRVLRDEISGDSLRAQLRIIHAARGIDEVDVVERGGEELFTGVNFTTEAGFKSVAPWRGTLEVRAEDGKRVLYTIPNVALKAGTSTTIVLTRTPRGGLEHFSFNDTPQR